MAGVKGRSGRKPSTYKKADLNLAAAAEILGALTLIVIEVLPGRIHKTFPIGNYTSPAMRGAVEMLEKHHAVKKIDESGTDAVYQFEFDGSVL